MICLHPIAVPVEAHAATPHVADRAVLRLSRVCFGDGVRTVGESVRARDDVAGGAGAAEDADGGVRVSVAVSVAETLQVGARLVDGFVAVFVAAVAELGGAWIPRLVLVVAVAAGARAGGSGAE